MAQPVRERPERRPFGIVHPAPSEGLPAGAALPMDLTRWGPILAGAVGSLAAFAFLMTLGAVIGLVTLPVPQAAVGTAVAIWTAICTAISFFLGGWITARTSTVAGGTLAVIEGFMVWAVGLLGVLFLSVVGLGSVFGALGVAFGPGAIVPPGPVDPTVVLAAFIMMAIGLAGAVLGSVIGTRAEMAEVTG